MKKKISIIIVTYNSDLLIHDCLDSIFKFNDIGSDLEVIIVDNLSKNVDLMFQTIKTKYENDVLLINNNQNGGYGQGNNVGIKSANGEIIMIMNPDVRLIMPVFKNVLSGFTKPNVVMVGMKQMYSIDKKGQSLLYINNSVLGIFENKLYSIFDVFIQSKMCFSGSCFFMKKNEFINLGLFDENIFMYGEEIDIHNRFTKKSNKNVMLYLNNLKYIHFVGDRLNSINAEINQLKSFKYLCEKYELNFINECKKRIRLYKVLRFKSKIMGRNLEIFDYSIKLFQENLKIK